MKQDYISLILSIERLHRRFLDVIKSELDRLDIEDINNVQTMILYNIGDGVVTVGELTNKGYYLGSNVSYNVKKLVETGFILQERSPHDKRSVKVKLSEKGLSLCGKIDELYQRNVEDLNEIGLSSDVLKETLGNMGKLEKYWAKLVNLSAF